MQDGGVADFVALRAPRRDQGASWTGSERPGVLADSASHAGELLRNSLDLGLGGRVARWSVKSGEINNGGDHIAGERVISD
jgi:hypothetical protein